MLHTRRSHTPLQNHAGPRARRALLLSVLALGSLAACQDADGPLSPTAAPGGKGPSIATGRMSGVLNAAPAVGIGAGELPAPNRELASAEPAYGMGPTDIVWQNANTGLRVFWHMAGPKWSGSQNEFRTVDPEWSIIATEDFTGDGFADLLWHKASTRESVIYHMVGRTWTGGQTALAQVLPGWTMVGAGDFTADGKPDIVWQNRGEGRQLIWKMNGVTWTGEQNELTRVDPRWWIVAVADFTGDGGADLVWQDRGAGRQVIWHMQGWGWYGAQNELLQVPSDWHVVGAADFTGDRKPDLLWQNRKEGRQLIWHMNGFTWGGAQNELVPVNPDWHIAAPMRMLTPAVVTRTAGDGQSIRAGSALPVAPTVRVTDAYGNPVRTVVTFAVTTGSIANPSASTGTDGVASAGTWTLGSTPGQQTLTATAGSASAVFTATAIDPCTLSDPHTFGSSLSARLDPGDCVLPGGRLADFYTVDVPAADGVVFNVSSASFLPEAFLYDASGKLIADSNPSHASNNGLIHAFLPADSYRLGATRYEASSGGRYAFNTYTYQNVTNCSPASVVPGVSTTQALENIDCQPADGRKGDEYRIRLAAGQSITVSQSSGAVDAYLQITREPDGVLVAENDNTPGSTNAQIVFTAQTAGTYRIRATSALPAKLGAYTISVQ
jgi:hypothetical protein